METSLRLFIAQTLPNMVRQLLAGQIDLGPGARAYVAWLREHTSRTEHGGGERAWNAPRIWEWPIPEPPAEVVQAADELGRAGVDVRMIGPDGGAWVDHTAELEEILGAIERLDHAAAQIGERTDVWDADAEVRLYRAEREQRAILNAPEQHDYETISTARQFLELVETWRANVRDVRGKADVGNTRLWFVDPAARLLEEAAPDVARGRKVLEGARRGGTEGGRGRNAADDAVFCRVVERVHQRYPDWTWTAVCEYVGAHHQPPVNRRTVARRARAVDWRTPTG